MIQPDHLITARPYLRATFCHFIANTGFTIEANLLSIYTVFNLWKCWWNGVALAGEMIGDAAARLHYTHLFEMLRNVFLIEESAPEMRPARRGGVRDITTQ